MCNYLIGRLRSCSSLLSSLSESLVDQPYSAFTMDALAVPAATASDDTDTQPRVKFLCSFGGSILPRPLDGKLRYVGGETRIVSVPRDFTYDELMARMRELFDAAALLKYQQPDEDLDALVSVVNDDDVTNMMEEYDKLGTGDGFTRLRIFLFPHPDQDVSPHFDSDERETERRYVDALNNLPELDKIHVGEQLYSPMNGIEVGGLHSQRNPDISMPPFNLHRIAVPHSLSGQHTQTHTPRYNEMEAPWSPAYYPSVHHGPHDMHPNSEFPSSPSSGLYRMPFGDLHDKSMDRIAEDYGRQPAFVDNVVWLPPGAIGSDKAGFPGNLSHSNNVFEGNSICEHCRMAFQRNQALSEARYPESRWRHGQPFVEQSSTGNDFSQFVNTCTECYPGRETYALNQDMKLEHGVYSKEQNEHRPFYNESHSHERGWVLHSHQLNHRADEPRTNLSGSGRVNEHYVVDGGMNMNFPLVHDGQSVPPNCINHDDPRYARYGPSGTELGNEGYHDQIVATGHHIHTPPVEDSGIHYGNFPPAYGMDNQYQVPHGSTPMHAIRRKVQNPFHGGPSHEASGLVPQANGTVNTGFVRGEGSPRLSHVGVEDQNPWAGYCCEPSHKVFPFDGSAAPEYVHDHTLKQNSNILLQESQQFAIEHVPSQSDMINISVSPQSAVSSPSTPIEDMASSTVPSQHQHPSLTYDIEITAHVKLEDETCKSKQVIVKKPGVEKVSLLMGDQKMEFNSNGVRPVEEDRDATKLGRTGDRRTLEQGELAQHLSFLPELIASVKKAALEGVEEVKAKAQVNDDVLVPSDPDTKELAGHELEPVNANNELEHESDSDHVNNSKIEPTKAEEEALARGLQTIKNDDLEEIRELGSGTYGAVFHGKWKGSDVAVKRIKASCFAGRPSERERLIADFWKEALILSSLHHPNVVSFYGIVRDGPDGTLATVTEFMVNGSLKQFLQKKDRTIDRRKRLIIAMDAAFGMEYLHGKNIVHFDLKCENLLVNMRDPHRPVCKIGDLGLSKVKQHTLVSGGVRGTLPWMAPELLSGKSNMVTEKIDVYSFGIVMWELLTGEEPYADMHCASIIGGIVNNTLRPQVPSWCDPEWKPLMESCWASDPGDRPSFSEISQKLRKMAAAINVK